MKFKLSSLFGHDSGLNSTLHSDNPVVLRVLQEEFVDLHHY